MRVDWKNEKHVKTLKQLFEAKYSASEIAEKMGMGLSRNAICGALRRLGLTRGFARKHPDGRVVKKPRVAKHKRVGIPDGSLAFKVINGIKKKQAARPGIDPEPFVCQQLPDLVPLNLTMEQLKEGQCRYIFGTDPATMVYCGHPIHYRMLGGEMRPAPYCEAHFLICTAGVPPARKAHRQQTGAAA